MKLNYMLINKNASDEQYKPYRHMILNLIEMHRQWTFHYSSKVDFKLCQYDFQGVCVDSCYMMHEYFNKANIYHKMFIYQEHDYNEPHTYIIAKKNNIWIYPEFTLEKKWSGIYLFDSLDKFSAEKQMIEMDLDKLYQGMNYTEFMNSQLRTI